MFETVLVTCLGPDSRQCIWRVRQLFKVGVAKPTRLDYLHNETQMQSTQIKELFHASERREV